MIAVSARMSIIVLMFWTCACVPLYIPVPEFGIIDGRELSEEDIEAIKVGSTTLKEVTNQVGVPNIIFEDDNIYVYNWEKIKAIFVIAAPGAVSHKFVPRCHALAIKFKDDIVKKYDFLKIDDCSDYRETIELWRKHNQG